MSEGYSSLSGPHSHYVSRRTLGVKRAYADTDYGQIHYFTAGSGHPLLLMHATNHSARIFADLLPLLSDEYQVVAPDYLGFGFSDPLPDDVTMADMSESMLGVLDAVGAETAHVFGLHTGNKIGVHLGARRAERLEKLVLCGEPHSIIPDEAERDAAIDDVVTDYLHEYPATSDGSHHLKEWADLQRRVSTAWWDPDVLAAEGATADLIDRLATTVLEQLCMRGSPPKIYPANYAYDWSGDLPAVSVETLVLELARADEVERYGRQAARVADRLPEGTASTLEDTGADVFYDEPARVAKPVRTFLEA